jgi:type I restriction enzyme S subunit
VNYPLQPLSELGIIKTGSTPLTSEPSYWGGDIPFVTPGELGQSQAVVTAPRTLSSLGVEQSRLLQKDAVMVCCIGSLGKIGIAGRPLVTNQQINSIDFNRAKILPKYGYYACKRLKSTLISMAPATTIPIVSKSKFGQLQIPVPTLGEQRRIADILDQADALRAQRREALVQLDNLTQSFFIEMFGDPVTNPKKFDTSSLGEAIAEMQYGPRFYDERYSPEGVRIVRITDLDSSGGLDFDSMPRMAIDEEAHSQYMLRPGDIVFARTGATVGKIALINQSAPPCIAGAYFIKLQFKDYLLPEYAYAALRTKSIQAIITAQSRQAAQQNFSGPGLRRLPMLIPSMSLQHAFKSRMLRVQKTIATHQESLTQLSELFSSLQHRAFRGTL